jgi:hypothetical protein
MPRCPVCYSISIRIRVHPRLHDASCSVCGASWQQVGSRVWAIKQGPRPGLIPTLPRAS